MQHRIGLAPLAADCVPNGFSLSIAAVLMLDDSLTTEHGSSLHLPRDGCS